MKGLMQDRDLVSYTQYEKVLSSGDVKEARIEQNREVPSGRIHLMTKDGKVYSVDVPDVVREGKLLTEKSIPFSYQSVPKDYSGIYSLLGIGVSLVAIVFFFFLFVGRGGQGSQMSSFGKSKGKLLAQKIRIGFRDVAGLDEEKEDLEEIVEFLKDPNRFRRMGARIPKGVLLVGPPGTGKTLLAKAIAGEAGVPFFSTSGSEFVEMFVGVGASRVRDLFEEAKKHSPCIVFIDEIDAVARQRGVGIGGSHDEREQTLNQLLVEMDGFAENEGIIILAATNRVDILDPAILRPGRFDRKIAVSRPDVKGREEILKLHSKNKPLSEDVQLKKIAQTTAGFTGADLENLMNEAALIAARKKKNLITHEEVEGAFVKTTIGQEKKSRVISEKEKRITAYHESGHAILFHVLETADPVHSISIIPTGVGAGGYTMPLPEKDPMYVTKKAFLEEIQTYYGGRIAEELIFGDITTGASEDIRQATKIARAMVKRYGMSERLGCIDYSSEREEIVLGKELAQGQAYGGKITEMIDEEVHRIMTECYQKAKDLLIYYMPVLHALAKELLEKEKLTGAEFEAVFAEASKSLPPKLDSAAKN